MRAKIIKILCRSSLMLALTAGAAQAQPNPGPTERDMSIGYPEQVALSQEGPKGWVYRRFPGGKRLYLYDLDKRDSSACNKLCEGAHTPVYAPDSGKPAGLWSIVARYDGTRQWAYRGRPVYTLYHDDPAAPIGDGEGGVWHLLPFASEPDSVKDLAQGQ
jgi:predicted lipoprotein with Yx(FWY)xxD motif